jgi:hypothetical protein
MVFATGLAKDKLMQTAEHINFFMMERAIDYLRYVLLRVLAYYTLNRW